MNELLRCYRDPERPGRYVVRDCHGYLRGVLVRIPGATWKRAEVWAFEDGKPPGGFATKREALDHLRAVVT